MKLRLLRIVGFTFVLLTVLFLIGPFLFDKYVAPLESETSLLLLLIGLSNFVQATLFFIWAEMLDRKGLKGP